MLEKPSTRTVAALYVVIFFLCTGIIGALWDFIWWHRYVGRDSFFILPHNILYASITINFIIAITMWTIERTKLWRRATLALLLPPIAGPLDEIWHTVIFREDPANVWAFWSPPHLMLALSFTLMVFTVLTAMRLAQTFRGRYSLEIILWSLMIFTLYAPLRPVMPTGTIYQVLGFWGTGPIVFTTIFMLMTAQFFSKGKNTALLVACSYMTVIGIVGVMGYFYQKTHGYNYHVVLQSLLGGYRVPPGWIHILGWLSTVSILDRYQGSTSKFYPAIAGLCFGGIIYGISFPFVGEAFRFSPFDGGIAIISSIAGGFLAGKFFENRKKTTFWKKLATM